MAVCSAFSTAVAFSLGKLGLSHVSLKEEQRSAIEAVYQRQDVFVCLPTGYGKSLCYQALPFLMDYKHKDAGKDARSSAVIVVSPLVALMEDQVIGHLTKLRMLPYAWYARVWLEYSLFNGIFLTNGM